jgi:dGTPase
MSTIRHKLEEQEKSTLSPHAVLSAESRGRAVDEPEHDYRTAFQRDRERIIHTKAFRRLKGKTQVFLAPKDDHFRNRLSHTLEVAQIARTVSRALFLNEDLTEAIALGHDLGHTPFGHAGEAALNEIYSEGFRHYEQSLRIVDILESTTSRHGLNLTQEVRDGILYHSTGKIILLGREGKTPYTLEGQVLSICDAIAYINHDISDALRAGVIQDSDLPAEALEVLGATASERISVMVGGLIHREQQGTLEMEPTVREATNILRNYLYNEVYPSKPIHGEVDKAKKVIHELYAYLLKHPEPFIDAHPTDDPLERKVVDIIAGMTDHYALELYQTLFLPNTRAL